MIFKPELTEVFYVGHQNPWEAKTPQELLDLLFMRLEENILDPTFEKYGNFIFKDQPEGRVTFFGNFFDYSCAFRIDTEDQELIQALGAKIRHAQTKIDYQRRREEIKNELPHRYF